MSVRVTHPIPDSTPTDPFGWRPAIPGVVAAQFHSGQDYAAPIGAPVYAAHSGRANAIWWDTFPDDSPAGGNMLQVGAAAFSTRYAHLSGYAVEIGDEVRAGQLIGYVGETGAATGPHLHFELLLPGAQYVDPVPYIREEAPMTEAEMKKLADVILDRAVKRTGTDKDGKPRTGTFTLRRLLASFEDQIGITRRIVERVARKLKA